MEGGGDALVSGTPVAIEEHEVGTRALAFCTKGSYNAAYSCVSCSTVAGISDAVSSPSSRTSDCCVSSVERAKDTVRGVAALSTDIRDAPRLLR